MDAKAADVRWKQRFQNLQKANSRLQNAAVRVGGSAPDELLRAGLIQTFEFSFELSWKTLKDYLFEGGIEVNSPRETLRMSLQQGIIDDGDKWMKAMVDRNKTSHIYDEEEAEEISAAILTEYAEMIDTLVSKLGGEL
ncbi:MAG: nucleotidyltransferase substrate binding protein [Bacteroidales bacterium]|nr:nucleotidyltransferase substrate binding protein [Bacteroidales bacterium]